MKKVVFVLACSGLLMTGCGEKMDEMKKGIEAAQQLSEKSGQASTAMDEAQKVYEERVAKGDTMAMPYKDLQGYLPTSISGYKAEGGPGGSQQNMMGLSISQAEQKWVSESNPNSRISVSLLDYGGTQGAYAMGSATFAMAMSSEDDHQRTESLKSDIPTTGGIAKFDKDNKSSSVILGTRYRFMITMESTGGTEDQTKLLTDVGSDVAKKLEGK